MYVPTNEIESLTAELQSLDRQRETLRAKAKAVKAALDVAIFNEHCDRWGLTPRQYGEAKAAARANGVPAHVALNDARAAANRERRDAQTAKVESAMIGVAGKTI